jgi:general secretion pathway protein C
MPKPRAALVATVEKLGEDHYRLPRDTVSQVLLDRTELTEAIKAVPTTAGDDVVGFKLFAVRPSSLAAKLGLRNFDRVTGLDELAFETEANVIAAYHRVATAPRVGLHYVRAQQRHTVVIEISP